MSVDNAIKKRMVCFSSIEQFRQIQRYVSEATFFVGFDDSNAPVIDKTRPLPKVTAVGTVKIHGTNAGVSYNGNELWAQSRSRIITPEQDNAGFASFVQDNKERFLSLFEQIKQNEEFVTGRDIITIYGEWAGENIQKRVAIADTPKSFYIFETVITSYDHNADGTTKKIVTCSLFDEDALIFNIEQYRTFAVEIDFKKPEEAINIMNTYTLEVENECPVAKKQWNKSGIGEGIVWRFFYKDKHYRFKTKGEKHSKTKVKTLNIKDAKAEKDKRDLAEKVTPSSRLEQGLTEIFGIGWTSLDLERKKIGDYIRWVIKDIEKEDLDLIKDKDLTIKDISKYVSQIASHYFFLYEKEGSR